MTRFFLKTSFVLLFISFLLIPFNSAWALYEVEDATPTNATTGLTAQQPPDDSLQIEWTEPDMGAGDSVIEYVYIWNNSDKPLDDTELNQGTNDGVVLGDEALKVNKNSSDFDGEDYDDPYWHFHIKTVYFSITEGEKFGDDLVVGPFNFDDQAPNGTIDLDTSVDGQTETTSLINPVTLALTATPDIKTVYLSNTSSPRPQDGVDFKNTLTHTVTEGVGEKTIYIWFEDQAGNTSSFYSLTFDIIAGKFMDPADDFSLQVNDTQQFLIQEADDETYVWSIVDPDTGDPTTVATFVDDISEWVDRVNIMAAQEGSFKVQATSDEGATVYESGTIMVTKSGTIWDVNGDSDITLDDVRLTFTFFLGGQSTAAEFYGANVYDDSDGNTSISLHDVQGVFTLFLGGTL